MKASATRGPSPFHSLSLGERVGVRVFAHVGRIGFCSSAV